MSKLKLNLILTFTIACSILAITYLFNIKNVRFSKAFAQTNTNQNQRNQNKKPLQVEFTAHDVIDESPEPNSPSERARINAKKRRYNKPKRNDDKNNGDPRRNEDLTQLPPGIGVVMGSEEPPPASLPVEQSTAIIIGKVIKAQPYLTESKTALFTEFTFEIENVLKSNDSSIATGNSVKIDREAGALRLTNGKVIRYDGSGFGKLPRVGRRYLLFLKPIHDGQDLSIVVGYELRDGKVFPLVESSIYSPETGKITKNLPFANMGELQLIQIVREAIANPNNMPVLEGGNNQ